MQSFKSKLLITLLSGSLFLSACNTERTNDEPEAGSAQSLNIALKNTIENSIIPDFTSFKTGHDSFQSQVDTFCSTTNQTNLSSLQDQWKALSSQWNRIAMYNLGPLNDDLIFPSINFIESMRQRGTDYTNTARGELSTILSNSTTLNQSYFDSLSFTRVGMLALEVLIFEDSNGVHATDLPSIVSDYQANSRKCDYLNGMSLLIGRYASTFIDGWETDFLNTGTSFKDTLIAGELEDSAESVPALITAIQEHLDYIKKRKLEAILDAQISNYFYQNITASLVAIEDLLEGTNAENYSLFDHMISSDFQDTVTLIKTNINTAKQAASDNNRSELSAAIGILDGNFKREVPDALNVVLGINFTDGD